MGRWVVVLVIGLGCLFFSTGIGINSGDVKCGDDVMTPGATCQTTINGVSSEKTYDQMLAERGDGADKFDSFGRWVLLGAGAVLTLLGGYKVIAAVRARGRQPAANPGQPYPGRQAGPQQLAPVSQVEPGLRYACETLAAWMNQRGPGPAPQALAGWYRGLVDGWYLFSPPGGQPNQQFLVRDRAVYPFAPSMQTPQDAVRSAEAQRRGRPS